MKPTNERTNDRYGITAESTAYARGFDDGYLAGYSCGLLDGYGRGYSDGVDEMARQR